jgi:hypothetical protein
LPSGSGQFSGSQTPTSGGVDIGDQHGKFGSMKNRKHSNVNTEDEIGI